MIFLKKIWNLWLKFAFFLGNLITGILMYIFYFTVFALFAIPFKIFSKGINLKPEKSSLIKKEFNFNSLDDFKKE
jgi:hypothetical protein